MLATILAPTDGTATVAGHDIRSEPGEVRSKLGFLSGDMGLYHRLTPREVLSFFGALAGISGQRLKQRTERLFQTFGIDKFADTRIDKLSTGMRQKVAIARTVVHEPPVLILDEPTSGLDVPTAHVVEQFILQAKAGGACILLSTHVMEEAEYLCDRIGVIHEGRLQALGTLEELRERSVKHRLREIFLDLLGIERQSPLVESAK
jgi:sodium transport system ATP-binding protein